MSAPTPQTASILAEVVAGVAKGAVDAMRAANDAEAIRIQRETLLEGVRILESAEARAKFPELRED